MDNLRRLEKILQQVGPQRIWRPVYGPGNKKLADGIGDQSDGLPQDLSRIDFRGKTVVDLGCNFGYYSFMVKKAGARHVTGIDRDPRIIQGCRLLKNLLRIEEITFVASDIAASNGIGSYDTGMMIDFIGKATVITGDFKDYLNVLERLSQKEMILSIRPKYDINKHLGNDIEGLSQKYPEDFLRHNQFHTLDYVYERFGPEWRMEIVSPASTPPGTKKETLYLKRKARSA